MNGQYTPRGEAAMAYFKEGYGCGQAVLMAFSDLTGLDKTTSARLGSSFGGGMGRMREVCGAFSGAIAALGLICGYDDPEDKEHKMSQYADVRELAERFKRRSGAGSIVCREILSGVNVTTGGVAEERTDAYYQRRPCPELCAIAADALDEMLHEKGIIE